MDEAAKNSRDGAAVNHNTAANTNMGEQKQDSLSTTTSTTTTAIPEVTDIISRELKNANLSGDMLSLVNIIGKVIQS